MSLVAGLLLGLAVAGHVPADGDCDGSAVPPTPVDTGVPIDPSHRFSITERQCVHVFTARDVEQLHRMLAERERNGSPRWHGLTRSAFDLRFELEPGAKGCRFRWLDLQVEISVWLPHWRLPPAARRRDAQRWQSRLAELQAHEQVHRRQMLDAALGLYRSLAALPAGDCAGFDRRARASVGRALLRLQMKGDAYDALTDHGRRTRRSSRRGRHTNDGLRIRGSRHRRRVGQ